MAQLFASYPEHRCNDAHSDGGGRWSRPLGPIEDDHRFRRSRPARTACRGGCKSYRLSWFGQADCSSSPESTEGARRRVPFTVADASRAGGLSSMRWAWCTMRSRMASARLARHCHGNGGGPPAVLITCLDAADLLRPPPIPARGHPAGSLALSPVHAELPRRGRPAGRARAQRHLRTKRSAGGS